MKSGIEIGVRSFSADDQRWFAEASRDSNPMHMDAVYARRTPAGAPVVHGMHLLATALELALASGAVTRIEHVRVKFPLPVTTGQVVRFMAEDREKFVRISARTAESTCATFDVMLQPHTGLVTRTATPQETGFHDIRAADHVDPSDLPLEATEDGAWQIAPFDHPALDQRFSLLLEAVGRRRLIGLFTLSFVVGMVCPGLYSIFSAADISFAGEDEPVLRTRVVAVDPRFRKVVQDVAGLGLSGTIEAFARVPAVVQPSLEDVAKLVAPGEFAGCRAVVVGGSRGLGEIAAKAIAAGGGDICITYAVGQSDASKLLQEIRSAHPAGTHHARQFDVRQGDPRALLQACSPLTHLLYFASPRITMRRTADVFEWATYQAYAEFYVGAFARLLEAARLERTVPLAVLYPSSCFVEEMPRGFDEYIAAKAAGETLCRAWDRDSQFAFAAPRYPRLLTDQTAGLVPVQMQSALEIVLASLREMESARRRKSAAQK